MVVPARLVSLSLVHASPMVLRGASYIMVRWRLMLVSWLKEDHRLISSSGRMSRNPDSSKLYTAHNRGQ